MDTSLGERANITVTTEILNRGFFAVFAVLEKNNKCEHFSTVDLLKCNHVFIVHG